MYQRNQEMVTLKVRRQDHPKLPSYWELFKLSAKPESTVTDLLAMIAKRPVNSRGESSTPVVFDRACGVGSCGACSLLINGKLMPACQATVKELGGLITVEPMKKFPLVRDLSVDKSSIEENLRELKAWPSQTFGGAWEKSLMNATPDHLSLCTSCGQCLEACPKYNDHSPYRGAAALTQAWRFGQNDHGASQYDRMTMMMESGGIEDCGSTQNCVKACPVGIPLTKILGQLSWETTKEAAKRFFKE